MNRFKAKKFFYHIKLRTRDLPGDTLVLKQKYNLDRKKWQNGNVGIFFNEH